MKLDLLELLDLLGEVAVHLRRIYGEEGCYQPRTGTATLDNTVVLSSAVSWKRVKEA